MKFPQLDEQDYIFATSIVILSTSIGFLTKNVWWAGLAGGLILLIIGFVMLFKS